MEAELAKMQEKLIIGGVTIQDRTTQQERELEVKRAKLAEERLKERLPSFFISKLTIIILGKFWHNYSSKKSCKKMRGKITRIYNKKSMLKREN